MGTTLTPTSGCGTDGSNGQIKFLDNNAYKVPKITVEWWLKTSTAGVKNMVVRRNANDSTAAWTTYIVNGSYQSSIYVNESGTENALLTQATNMNDGNWHHLAFTFDGTTQRNYMDGSLLGTKAVTGNLNSGAQPLVVGATAVPDGFILGSFDEVRVTNYARYTDTTIPNFGSLQFVDDGSTVLLVHMNEGTGTVAIDSSSTANNGSLLGGATWIGGNVYTSVTTLDVSPIMQMGRFWGPI